MAIDLSRLRDTSREGTAGAGFPQPEQVMPVAPLSALSVTVDTVELDTPEGTDLLLAFTWHTTFGRQTFMVPASTVLAYVAPRVVAAAQQMATHQPGLVVPQLVPPPDLSAAPAAAQ